MNGLRDRREGRNGPKQNQINIFSLFIAFVDQDVMPLNVCYG